MKTKIERVNIGKYDYDAIVIIENDIEKEIVFLKKDEVSKYEGKTVELEEKDGKFSISISSSTKKTIE